VTGKIIDDYCNLLLKNACTYSELEKKVAKYKSQEGLQLLRGSVAVITSMQRDKMPAKLIEDKLKERYGTAFKVLVTAFGGLVGGRGSMPRGWKSMNLNTNHEEDENKSP